MPGCLVAFASGFAKDVAAPEHDVVADDAGDEVDDLGVARKVEEVAHTAHAFAVVAVVALVTTAAVAAALDMRRHQLLGSHAGVAAQQGLQRVDHHRHTLRRQAELRHDPALRAVLADLFVAQPRHVI